MGLLRKWREYRAGIVPVPHYAPDISLTAFPYFLPISAAHRQRLAQRRIDDFLAHTSPDKFNGAFLDAYIQAEEDLLISYLNEQTPNHNRVNAEIALAHRSEFVRLVRTIRQMEDAVAQIDNEIDEYQQIYKIHNL